MSDEILHACNNHSHCTAQVGRDRFACPECWYKLPPDIRRAISASYRKGMVHQPPVYTVAAARARAWFKSQGKQVTMTLPPREPGQDEEEA